MEKCVFCQIVAKEVPALVVYEDEYCLAFLDINPRSKGMTIVASKRHYNEFDEDFELSSKIFESAMVVAEMVKQALQPKAVSLAVMPSAVPHFHVRIYPFYEKEIPIGEAQPIQLSESEFKEIAGKIKAVKVEVKKEEKEKPKEEPKQEGQPRSDEDVYQIQREMEIG